MGDTAVAKCILPKDETAKKGDHILKADLKIGSDTVFKEATREFTLPKDGTAKKSDRVLKSDCEIDFASVPDGDPLVPKDEATKMDVHSLGAEREIVSAIVSKAFHAGGVLPMDAAANRGDLSLKVDCKVLTTTVAKESDAECIFPKDEAVKRGDRLLPPDWTARISRSTGKPYYYNTKTGQSQFEMPVDKWKAWSWGSDNKWSSTKDDHTSWGSNDKWSSTSRSRVDWGD